MLLVLSARKHETGAESRKTWIMWNQWWLFEKISSSEANWSQGRMAILTLSVRFHSWSSIDRVTKQTVSRHRVTNHTSNDRTCWDSNRKQVQTSLNVGVFKCICEYIVCPLVSSLSRVYYELTIWPAPSWLRVGAQLVRHWSGIAEVMDSNLVHAWICFKLCITTMINHACFHALRSIVNYY